MTHVNSIQRAATLGRMALCSLVLIAMALTTIVALAPAGSAQVADPDVIFTIDDYQLEPGPEPIDVFLEVDPLALGLAGFELTITYDPAVIQPVLAPLPICEPVVSLIVSCGPPSPTGELIVAAFTGATLTEPGNYVRIPFLALVNQGQSELTLAIEEVIDSNGNIVQGGAVNGSVTVGVAPATCLGELVTIDMNTGASGIGTQGDDVILGTPGPDVIRGLGGDDVICGGPGDDELFGNYGNDIINGGNGDDLVIGNVGDDRVRGGQGDDIVRGSGGNDEVFGNAGDDVLQGGQGDDIMRGDGGDDDVRGGAGNDRLRGGDQNDLLRGDSGNDYLNGGLGSDEMRGGADVDRCITDSSGDTVFGCEL